MNKKSETRESSTSQNQRFIETAYALGCDEDEAAFKAKLAMIARHKLTNTSKADAQVSSNDGDIPMIAEFPQNLTSELSEGWVTRQRILKVLRLEDSGVRQAVTKKALQEGLVAERRRKGEKFFVSYHFREPRGSEQPGTLIEVGDET